MQTESNQNPTQKGPLKTEHIVKSSNICIIGTPELKNREHVEKAIFGEFTAKKLPKLSKIIKTEIQEVRRIQLG